jgi:uncharacterized protein YggT (Ycf19 family)
MLKYVINDNLPNFNNTLAKITEPALAFFERIQNLLLLLTKTLK